MIETQYIEETEFTQSCITTDPRASFIGTDLETEQKPPKKNKGPGRPPKRKGGPGGPGRGHKKLHGLYRNKIIELHFKYASNIDPKPMDIVAEVADLRSQIQSDEARMDEQADAVNRVQLRSQTLIDRINREKTKQPIQDPLIPDPVTNRPRRIHRTQRCYKIHKGYFCAAAHAKHTPKPYSSLRPVSFFVLYFYLFFCRSSICDFEYIDVQIVKDFCFIGNTLNLERNNVRIVETENLGNIWKTYLPNIMPHSMIIELHFTVFHLLIPKKITN